MVDAIFELGRLLNPTGTVAQVGVSIPSSVVGYDGITFHYETSIFSTLKGVQGMVVMDFPSVQIGVGSAYLVNRGDGTNWNFALRATIPLNDRWAITWNHFSNGHFANGPNPSRNIVSVRYTCRGLR